MNSIYIYNDQLIVFLTSVLRDIPYLADAKEETITNIAFTMKQDFLEPGSTYFHAGDS